MSELSEQTTHYLILSPHLDDAALSCADHARGWTERGDQVTCYTIFTQFTPAAPSPYQKPFLAAQGFASTGALQEARLREDRAAMQILGLPYEHLGLTDAAFRTREGQHLYQSYKDLTPGRVDHRSRGTYETLRSIFRNMASEQGQHSQVVALPLGVGGHIDHCITRKAAEEVWPESQRIYYLDFPYALRPWKYSLPLLWELLRKKRSILPISSQKRGALTCYTSQMPFLFRSKPRYPEVLLYGKNSYHSLTR